VIASVEGLLRTKSPTEVLIDVNGIGFAISIPLSTYEKLDAVGSRVVLLTVLHVREDAMQLFGFATEEERRVFKLLISVSGIGPKIAQSVLSGMNAEELKSHLGSGNITALTSIPGVGRKTAERLVVELRDKIGNPLSESGSVIPADAEAASVRFEALRALVSLGYSQQAAERSIRLALKESGGSTLLLEELIKRALRQPGS
jgi:Holliday junction DNA helicase RuvA